jgi:hypothetical protein
MMERKAPPALVSYAERPSNAFATPDAEGVAVSSSYGEATAAPVRGLSNVQIERLGPIARVVRRLIRYVILRDENHDVR